MEPLLTAQELADYLGIQLTTVHQWSKRGHGPKALRPHPHLVRYRTSDVEAWLESESQK
jgi:excisionase family DNA binding protein